VAGPTYLHQTVFDVLQKSQEVAPLIERTKTAAGRERLLAIQALGDSPNDRDAKGRLYELLPDRDLMPANSLRLLSAKDRTSHGQKAAIPTAARQGGAAV
jgi:hypothetical protein